MNLSRAKTVLIFAFLGLNIFLGYHLFLPYAGTLSQTAVSSAELQRAENYLAENNYFLQTDISRTVKQSAFLTVAPAQQFLDGLMAKYSSGAVIVEENGATHYRDSGRELILYPGGLVQLEWQPGVSLADGQNSYQDDRELTRLVEQFLGDNYILPEQASFDYIESRPESRKILHFYQEVNGVSLFSGYLKVFTERDQITSVELYWLDLMEGPREEEMEVIPATDALTKLVEELGPGREPRDIIKVELGYFSREYNAEMWEVPPVWRILLEGGSVYYINAFTGNLEADL